MGHGRRAAAAPSSRWTRFVLDWLQSVASSVLIDGLLPSSRADIATEGYA